MNIGTILAGCTVLFFAIFVYIGYKKGWIK